VAWRWGVEVFDGATSGIDKALEDLAGTGFGADAVEGHQNCAPRP
jgi:hypothetical protein